jgi:ubiquinone/menaquinone biosynthesis C-methylase UbiE
MLARPAGHNVFDRIVQQLRDLRSRPRSVLELGSGPGFLADRIAVSLSTLAYTALDCSAAMHALARERLGANAERVCFVEGDFKQPHWTHGLTTFDAVVTMQAVHELRHDDGGTRSCPPGWGFTNVHLLLQAGGLVLYRGDLPAVAR